jgi:hypothetical protein
MPWEFGNFLQILTTSGFNLLASMRRAYRRVVRKPD